jgi:hypothetical protein
VKEGKEYVIIIDFFIFKNYGILNR